LNKEVLQKLKANENKEADKNILTDRQEEIYNLNQEGNNQEAIANKLDISKVMVCKTLLAVEKKGFEVNKFYPSKINHININ
jgi:DNA-binding NarL/FixJ family response regulator